MKLYFAGNFEFFNHPEKEKLFSEFCLEEFGCYNRLGSFFFKAETGRLLNVVKEVISENQDRRTQDSGRETPTSDK